MLSAEQSRQLLIERLRKKQQEELEKNPPKPLQQKNHQKYKSPDSLVDSQDAPPKRKLPEPLIFPKRTNSTFNGLIQSVKTKQLPETFGLKPLVKEEPMQRADPIPFFEESKTNHINVSFVSEKPIETMGVLNKKNKPKTIDGHRIIVNDKILLVNQTPKCENGIWQVQTNDWIQLDDVNYTRTFFVENGNANAETIWECEQKSANKYDDKDFKIVNRKIGWNARKSVWNQDTSMDDDSGYASPGKEYDQDLLEKPPTNKAETWKKLAENAGISQSQMDKFSKVTNLVQRQLMHDYEQKQLPTKLKSVKKQASDDDQEDTVLSDLDLY